MRFSVLGPLDVSGQDGPLPLGGPKQRIVLAHLVLAANRVVSAEQLIDALWGKDLPDDPKSTVQIYVSRLRKVLGAEGIEAHPPGYLLRAEREEVDVLRFEDLLAEARGNGSEPRTTDGILTEALGLWRGPALADLAEEPSLQGEIARLEELRLQALEELFHAELDLGHHASVVAELESLTRSHPLRERLCGELMLALYRCDRQAEALAAFERARTILSEELGIDPSPELRRLHERILRQDPDLELKGEPLRGYRLLEQIGEGAFGVVYRAIQPQVHRDVAVKVIHPHLANNPEFIRRFESEAQCIARLEHPHVVPLYDYWREPRGAYLVMRYLRGGNLAEALADGPLELKRAAWLLDQVCGALAAGHRQGVVHGDVNPTNILLDEEGNAFLADFGIAKDVATADRTGPGPIKGSLLYLAPEQILGEAITPRTDLYALGVVLYEMLVGEHPLQGVPDLAVYERQLREPLPPVGKHRKGLPAGVDDVIATATAKDAKNRFRDALSFAHAFRNAIPTANITVPAAAPALEARNPYKGLRPFMEADADDFYGREALVERLLKRWGRPGPHGRFLAVVGPSGSGKSSAIRAGLVPALRRGGIEGSESWFITDLVPGRHPMEELEAALLRVAAEPPHGLLQVLESGPRELLQAVNRVVPKDSELILVVDQFEEVFTLTEDESERALLLESLRVAAVDPASRVRVVTTLRADFYDRPLIYPRFGELLGRNTEVVTPLAPDELERAIVRPASSVGQTVEPALVAQVASDVAEQPGALPLVQYALTELFDRRREGRLTLEAYREIGGVGGALAASAEHLFERRQLGGRDAVRELFLSLVTLGEGTPDTRRRVRLSELSRAETDPAAIESALDAYGRHRLLTFDRDPASREPTVEVAHEALLTAWDRLRGWIDEARDDLRVRNTLASAAADWVAAGRDESFLLRGARLERIAAWAETTTVSPSVGEAVYLRASVERRDEERATEAARQEHDRALERRSIRRLRGVVAAVTAAALVASVLTAVAVDQRSQARREARLATARELAAAAVANLEIDPERSILLAMEAVKTTRSSDGTVLAEAEEALHRAVVASRVVMSVPGFGGRLDWSPRGDVFATEGSTGSGVVDIRDVETGQSIGSFPGHDGDITDVAFSPDGSMLATTGVDGFLKVWDPADGALLMEVSGVGEARGPSFSDGRLASAAWPEEGAVRVVNTLTDRVVRSFGDLRGANATSLGPGGARIAVSTILPAENDRISKVYLVDVASSERLRVEGLAGTGAQVDDVAWSPDGDLVAAGADATLKIWEAATGELRHSLSGHSAFITSVDWRPGPSSRVLITGGEDGAARVWSIEEGGATRTMSLLSSEMTNVTGVAFSPDGTRVMTGNDLTSPGIKIWDVSPAGDAEWVNLPADFAGQALFISARRMLASGGGGPLSDLVTLWDIEAPSEPRRVRTFHLPGSRPCCAWELDASADGATAAISWFDDGASVRDVATGDELFFVPAPEDVVTPSDLSPDGRYLAVGMGRDRAARIISSNDIDLGAYRAVRILDRSGHEVGTPLREDGGFLIVGFRFAPDSRLIATASHRGADQRVRIWDRERGVVVTEIADGRFEPRYETMTFDPSGRLIASAADRQVRIWDVESGALVATLPSQPSEIWAVAFSPNGASVATAGSDRTVRLFDVRSETQRLVLHGSDFDAHSAAIVDPSALFARSVAFSPDGSLLASVDGTTVRVWALDIDDLLEIARQNVTRSLTDEECRQYLHMEACPNS